ncbi:MAG: ribonuclease domain-containing protein [Aristaeellaceae bacterium]
MSRRNHPQSRRLLTILAALTVALLAGLGALQLPEEEAAQVAMPAAAVQTQAPQTGPVTEPQAIADYLFAHGELPDNFITKAEARKLGWDSARNDLSDVAPGYSIGGDRFGNYEGLLPDADGRIWYEADCYYTEGDRGACRIVYSSDGLVYYTGDHYASFTQMYPSGE